MASAVIHRVTSIVCCLTLIAIQINGQLAPNCPTVLCFGRCPDGQYLALSEEGCETCDCYDPCEGYECSSGKCRWSLNEDVRPEPYCDDDTAVVEQETAPKEESRNVPSCAVVMCAEPCPEGMYLAMNEHGCETCDCYDPCESHHCDVGECHWMLDDHARPSPFCINCEGGQQWSTCTGGSACVPTCANITPLCNRNCYPGCQCPRDRPVLHHGVCIMAEQCRDSCEGGQEWTDRVVTSSVTCNSLYQDNSLPTSGWRCQCPDDRPVWDAVRSLCVTKSQCVLEYYQDRSNSDASNLVNELDTK